MENRHGLVVDAQVTQATGAAEREAAVEMVAALSGTHRVTLGADKNYDTRDCVDALRYANVIPHVAQNTSNRSSEIVDALPATKDTRSVSESVNGSKNALAGRRSSAACATVGLSAARSWTSNLS
jgi:hypothetical protein